MAGPVIYLEIDDEITSAAARIRDSTVPAIALVLPSGSRVATSRINFRLLSRDAQTHDKQLTIVSADPAARALAASAGLPVHASVAEYEASLAGQGAADMPGQPAAPGEPAEPAPTGMAAGEGSVPKPKSAAKRRRATPPATDPDSTLGLVVPVVAPGDAAAGFAGETIRTSVPSAVERRAHLEPARERTGPTAAPSGAPVRHAPTAEDAGTRRGAVVRTPWIVGGAILALALLVGGVGAYVLLPSASVVVTPRSERVGPLQITVVADPTVTEPDPVAGVVPATEISIPLTTSDTFSATGKRVELTKATGTVRFLNFDFLRQRTIAAGSVVSTSDGIKFRTDAAVTIPRADRIGAQLFPSRASVKVTAVTGGEAGNVEADTIVVVPSGENRLALTVSNPDPTAGGSREEFARVTQEDVDGALATLNVRLAQAFQEAMRDPALDTGGATVFPTSGQLDTPIPDVDPETLVGQEVATFPLSLSGTGTVVAVQADPVSTIAETQLRSAVDPDHQLVAGSVDIAVGEAVVIDRVIQFPVTATAEQIAILDPDELRTAILGRTIDDARTILEGYGQVRLSVSPDWTGSVPGFESRVSVTIDQAVQVETPSDPAPSGSVAP